MCVFVLVNLIAGRNDSSIVRYFYLIFSIFHVLSSIPDVASFYFKISHDIRFRPLLNLRPCYSSCAKNYPACCNYSNVQFVRHILATFPYSLSCTDARFDTRLTVRTLFPYGMIDILLEPHIQRKGKP